MKLYELKQEVLEANLSLVEKNLVVSTWGNVSGFFEDNEWVIIKASGIPYSEMNIEHMIVVDLKGQIVEGNYSPSTDTPTHIELYKSFKDRGIKGIVHTHSKYATIWAQSGNNIPCYGTTHGDYFYGEIPITREMLDEEILNEYEKNTGRVILERFEEIDFIDVPAVLVNQHGPFTWGETPSYAVLISEVLEYISEMALANSLLGKDNNKQIQRELLKKHHERKFGNDSYYGQKGKAK